MTEEGQQQQAVELNEQSEALEQPEQVEAEVAEAPAEEAPGQDDGSDALATEDGGEALNTGGEAVAEGEAVAGGDEEAPAEEPLNPNMAWYILRVNTGYEDQVRKGLEARIEQQELHSVFGRILVPKEEVLQFHGGEKRRTKRKLYPGYVFVEMDRTPSAMIMIREVPRVSGFVGAEDRRRDPKPLSRREVRRLLAHVETPVEEPEIVQHFERGEKVKIADGAFSNFIGVIDDVREERRKLRVLVTIFGRQTPVEVSYNQVNRTE